ncbi:uncharacterized protein [Equus przewalskii]|uniref:Uncharacterized protein isoform X1 n=1 Tax=Equus przewalskii TaxID=9798 RepID=A0ABM4MLS5_EQUPR
MYFILRADALGSRRGVESSLLQCWIHKRVFMVCERISVCLGRKLFDLQKSQKTSRMSPCSNWPLLTHENGWSCSGLTVEKIRFTAWMGEQQKESPERKKLILKKISLKINQRTFHSPIKEDLSSHIQKMCRPGGQLHTSTTTTSLSYTWTSVEHIHLTTEKHCYQVMWLLKENTEQVFSVLIVMPSQQYAPYCLRSGAGVD